VSALRVPGPRLSANVGATANMNGKFALVVTICLFLAACRDGAGEPVYLNFSDLPDRSVRVVNSSNTEIELDLAGEDELIEQNRQRGISFPVRFSNYKTQTISTRTGSVAEDGSFPFERTFEHAASYSEDENGNRIRIPDSGDQMVGLVVKGVIDGSGKMLIESVRGGSLDAETEAIIRPFMESLAAIETAPKTPLRVGDTFSTEMPFDMPIPGREPIRVQSTSDYTLVRVEGDKAIFDIDMTFDMASPPDGVRLNANGAGSGTMQYNLKTQLRETLDMEMVMEMEFQTGEVLLSSKMRSNTSMKQYRIQPGAETPDRASDPGGGSRRPMPAG
jgi:hypothetical protein